MSMNPEWNTALLYTGQNVKPEDIVKYSDQLKEVDEELWERTVALAEEVSLLPISHYLITPMDTSSNNAAVQMTVHTLNVISGNLALAKISEMGGMDKLIEAGHSLGEAAALEEVFPSRRANIQFVFERGSVMQRAYETSPGSLYMIDGLTEEQVDEIAPELEVAKALVNGPTLIFVGSTQGRTDLERPLKEAGAKKVTDFHLLPFHTLYMEKAQSDMKAFIGNAKYEFKQARFPIVSNLNGLSSQMGRLLVDNHVASFTSPVRWSDSIATMNHEGVTFYTLGPGNNTATLNRLNGIPKERTKDLFQLLAE